MRVSIGGRRRSAQTTVCAVRIFAAFARNKVPDRESPLRLQILWSACQASPPIVDMMGATKMETDLAGRDFANLVNHVIWLSRTGKASMNRRRRDGEI